MNRTLLVNVPPWYPNQPYLSIPLLTGILRQYGYETFQRDINLNFFDILLSRSEIKKQFDLIDPDSLIEKERLLYELRDYFIDDIDKIKKKTRDIKNYIDLEQISEIFEDIELILKVYKFKFSELEVKLGQFNFGFNYFDPQEILEFLDSESNLFNYYYLKYESNYLKELVPNIVGISITTPEQLIPALAYIKVIRKTLPTTKILLGGDYISRIVIKFVSIEEFLDLFDFILTGEAEESIVLLYKSIGNINDYYNIPNLIWKDTAGKTIINETRVFRLHENSYTPDFDGLKLDQYFSPHFVIPYEVSKGCYWGKCKFCEIAGKQYSQKMANNVVDDIEFLSMKYQTKYFTFVSSAPSPRLLKKISERLIQKEIEIIWSTMIRVEDYIDDGFIEVLYQGGFKFAMIGVESGDQTILNNMNKGVKIENIVSVLRMLGERNILTHCYFMFDFENETQEQRQKTMKFISDNAPNINSYSISSYVKPLFKDFINQSLNIYYDNSQLDQSIKDLIKDDTSIPDRLLHINTYLIG